MLHHARESILVDQAARWVPPTYGLAQAIGETQQGHSCAQPYFGSSRESHSFARRRSE